VVVTDAVSVLVWPVGRLLGPTTSSEVTARATTDTIRVPEAVESLAFTTVVPKVNAVSIPVADTDATAGFEDDQVALLVTSCEVVAVSRS
jgi:hypothetical protein